MNKWLDLIVELETGGYPTNDWETERLKEWKNKYRDREPTRKIKECLEKMKMQYIEGKDTRSYEPQTAFGDFEVKQTTQGYFVHFKDKPLGSTIARIEGTIIAEWLASSQTDLVALNGELSSKIEREPGDEEDAPAFVDERDTEDDPF